MRGDGRVFKRGGMFWISYYAPVGGRSVQHRESGGGTEAEARKLLRQRLREIAVHKAGLRTFQGPKAERIAVDELLETLEKEYKIQGRKGLAQLRSHLKHIRAFFTMDRALARDPEPHSRLYGFPEKGRGCRSYHQPGAGRVATRFCTSPGFLPACDDTEVPQSAGRQRPAGFL